MILQTGRGATSRAGAEVLIGFTGSEDVPGGMSGRTIQAGAPAFEQGPTTDLRLAWATDDDASDQAARSRLWGGIHVPADDLRGPADRIGLRDRRPGAGRARRRRHGRLVRASGGACAARRMDRVRAGLVAP